jgi:hypothetical protein
VPECRGHRRRQTKVSFDGEGRWKNDGARTATHMPTESRKEQGEEGEEKGESGKE